MSRSKRPVYQERTGWPGWLWVVIWGTLAMGAVAILSSNGATSFEDRAVGLIVLLAVGAFLQWVLGGVSVRLFNDRMEVGLGNRMIFRRTIPYEDIQRVEVRRYHPLKDFGGWGFRIAKGKRAYTTRGDEAVVLSLVDGMEIYVGSDHPGRLRERIATLAGKGT